MANNPDKKLITVVRPKKPVSQMTPEERREFAKELARATTPAIEESAEAKGYVDLPFESGSADPQEIQYADLGPDKKYVEGEDFRDAQARAKGESDDGT